MCSISAAKDGEYTTDDLADEYTTDDLAIVLGGYRRNGEGYDPIAFWFHVANLS